MKALVLLIAVTLCAAGCGTESSSSHATAAKRLDSSERAPQNHAAVDQTTSRTVIEWNAIALRTTAAAPLDPPRESRALAMVHGAIYDAVQAITGEFPPYLVSLSAP